MSRGNRMDDHIDVTVPVEGDIARALESPARREAAGREPSGLLKAEHLRDVLSAWAAPCRKLQALR